jgi:hypothetical protein
LKSHYKIHDAVKVQKIAVVDIEFIDKQFIQEINVFVLDVSKINKYLQNEGNFWLHCFELKYK